MIRYFVALFFFVTCGVSSGATPNSIDNFRQETTSSIISCQATEGAVIKRKSLLEEEIIEAIVGCIKDGKANARKKFPSALSSVSKKPSSAILLKDYYAAWTTAIDGIMPRVNEREIDYTQRQIASETRYNEIWNRFEIEAGF